MTLALNVLAATKSGHGPGPGLSPGFKLKLRHELIARYVIVSLPNALPYRHGLDWVYKLYYIPKDRCRLR